MTSAPDPVLDTARLVLRCLTPADLDHLAVLYADPLLRRYFPDGTRSRAQTLDELTWFVDVGYARHGFGLWATVLKQTGAFIGRCGLLPVRVDGREEVEVAYLLDRRFHGRGLATEAARAIVAHAFTTLPVDRVVSLVEPGNTASGRVAIRAGMTLVRTDHVDEFGTSYLYARQRPGRSDGRSRGGGRVEGTEDLEVQPAQVHGTEVVELHHQLAGRRVGPEHVATGPQHPPVAQP